MTSLWAITLVWVGAVIALNSMQAALTTVVADRFAPSERGTASGFVGAGMTSGLTVGTIVAGLLAGTITFAYWLFAGAIIVVCLARSEEHTSELQSLMRISYAVFCLKKNKIEVRITTNTEMTT